MNWLMALILKTDLTVPYAVLVWAGMLLSVWWLIVMRNDPTNRGVPEWHLRIRRTGTILITIGFMLTVLFGGDLAWTPWPPMLLVALGFDVYLAGSILVASRRCKLFNQRMSVLHARAAARSASARGTG